MMEKIVLIWKITAGGISFFQKDPVIEIQHLTIHKKEKKAKKKTAVAKTNYTTQLTFSSTNNREFEQIPLNWSRKLPLNCTSLREFRKSPLKSTVMRLFRYFLLHSLGNDVSYRFSWPCSHFILK